jgi:hypothetical protein
MLRCLIAVPVVVVAIGLAAGCGGSSSGSASYLGRAPGLVLFLQWTRSGRSLTGSAEVAEMPATDSYDDSSDDVSFTGTINGDSVSLRFDSPVGGARTLTGHLHGESARPQHPNRERGVERPAVLVFEHEWLQHSSVN